MLIEDRFGHIEAALSRCECLLVNRAKMHPDDADVIVGNNAELLRVVRIALSVARGERVTCEELVPYLGPHWVVVRQRRPDRPHYARCGTRQRQILPREYEAGERAALEGRFPFAGSQRVAR